MVKVKICGITNWADARAALDAGADALGFNFYAPSPRYISPDTAREIIRRMPRRASGVGVFVNESVSRVAAIARAVGLRLVQLHGGESPRVVRQLLQRFLVIKAIQVRPGFRTAQLARYCDADAILLDGFHDGLHGGTGQTIDWTVVREAKRYGAILLAGGLTPENVAHAIVVARPFGIDVSSGVEARPGKKDARKIRALMRAVEAAQRRAA